MSSNNSNSEIRDLAADEIDTVSGALHVHLPGIFHLAVGEQGASIGVFGLGVGVDSEGVFTFTFS